MDSCPFATFTQTTYVLLHVEEASSTLPIALLTHTAAFLSLQFQSKVHKQLLVLTITKVPIIFTDTVLDGAVQLCCSSRLQDDLGLQKAFVCM